MSPTWRCATSCSSSRLSNNGWYADGWRALRYLRRLRAGLLPHGGAGPYPLALAITLVVVPLSDSTTDGLAWGMISYSLLAALTGRKVHPLVHAMAAVFVARLCVPGLTGLESYLLPKTTEPASDIVRPARLAPGSPATPCR